MFSPARSLALPVRAHVPAQLRAACAKRPLTGLWGCDQLCEPCTGCAAARRGGGRRLGVETAANCAGRQYCTWLRLAVQGRCPVRVNMSYGMPQLALRLAPQWAHREGDRLGEFTSTSSSLAFLLRIPFCYAISSIAIVCSVGLFCLGHLPRKRKAHDWVFNRQRAEKRRVRLLPSC